MPLDPARLSAYITSSGPLLNGPVWYQIVGAVSLSVYQWVNAPTPVSGISMNGITSGTLGGGSVSGKLFVKPAPLMSLQPFTFVGPNSGLMGAAIGFGFTQALNLDATYVGASSGVSSGTDVSKVTSVNIPSLIGILQGNFVAFGIGGPTGALLASSIGTGIATIALTGVGVAGVVVGSASPLVGSGTSISKVV
jgi:hypothetical protein